MSFPIEEYAWSNHGPFRVDLESLNWGNSLRAQTDVATRESGDVQIAAVDAFWRQPQDCKVSDFRDSRAYDDMTAGEALYPNLNGRFDGLVGKGIPFGHYTVIVHCSDGNRGSEDLLVSRRNSFLVIATGRRIGDSVWPRPGPPLTIHVTPRQTTLTWIRISSPFSGFAETSRVDPNSQSSAFYSTSAGRFVIYLLAPGRIICSGQLTFEEEPHTTLLLDAAKNCAVQLENKE